MDYPMEFPKFIQALKALGYEAPASALLTNPRQAWLDTPVDVRLRVLEALGVGSVDPDAVEIRLAKRPDAPRTLDNVLLILRIPDLPPGAANEDPEAAAGDATSDGQAAASDAAPEPAPTSLPAPAVQSPLEAAPAAVANEPGPEAFPAPEAAAPFETVVETSDEPVLELGEIPHRDLGIDSASAGVKTPEPLLVEEAPAEIPRPPAEPAKKKSFWSKFTSKLAGDEAPDQKQPVTVVPPITEPGVREVEVYPVQAPYAYVRVTYNDNIHEHLYEIIEPQMTEREQKVLEFVENTLVDVIEVGLTSLEDGGAEEALRKHVDEILYDYSITLNSHGKDKLLYYIIRDFLGNGKMEPVMRDELIEDISCDGPQAPLFLYHRKYESVKSTVRFPSHQELDSFVIRLAQRSGKHISIAEPLLDATMPDGSRLNATLSDEVTSNGSTFTIRKFRPDPFTPPDLVRFGTMSADMLAYWWLAVQHGASAIYAGGTASGKTTSLNAILLFIPPQMKIVSIEDTREINLPHPNWIAGVTRSGFGPRDNNGRQAGEIDMFTLLKAALRQRPEYILVGEVRGQEAYALFQAMATGHTAYGTMHADSVESVIHRLESDPISIPRSLLESLDIVSIQIQTRIGSKRVRRTKELVEIVGLDPHTRELLTNEVFNWNSTNDTFEFTGVSYVLERIQMERNMSEKEMKEELVRRKDIIHWMIKKGLRDYKAVGHIIASYYKEPEKTVETARKELAEMAAKEAEEAAKAAEEGTNGASAVALAIEAGTGAASETAAAPGNEADPFASMRAALAAEEDEGPGA